MTPIRCLNCDPECPGEGHIRYARESVDGATNIDFCRQCRCDEYAPAPSTEPPSLPVAGLPEAQRTLATLRTVEWPTTQSDPQTGDVLFRTCYACGGPDREGHIGAAGHFEACDLVWGIQLYGGENEQVLTRPNEPWILVIDGGERFIRLVDFAAARTRANELVDEVYSVQAWPESMVEDAKAKVLTRGPEVDSTARRLPGQLPEAK